MTKSETVLWKHIKGDVMGWRFRRQHSIGNFIVDFYSPKLKLAIEVDGLTHYEKKVFEKDLVKDKFLANIGIVVKRYNSEQVFNDLENVLQDIYITCQMLSGNLKTSATPPTPSW